MTIKPIRTETDYQQALREIEQLWNAPAGSSEADQLDVLFTLVAAYEAEHHAIDLPDPLAMLEHVMESRGLTHEQLEPYLGSARLVEAVLSRQRPLTLAMIRRLHRGLGIPADVLIAPYELAKRRA
jgi:HTH-type transcriptional regulator/antitoxin HigA